MMNNNSDATADTLQYLNLAIQHISTNKTIGQTAKGVAKQAGYAVGGTVVGGVALGPIGALAGSMIGSAIGFAVSDKYNGVLQRVLNMNDQQKSSLVQEIKNAVGANPIEKFYKWYAVPGNAETVNTLILAAIGMAAASSSSRKA